MTKLSMLAAKSKGSVNNVSKSVGVNWNHMCTIAPPEILILVADHIAANLVDAL